MALRILLAVLGTLFGLWSRLSPSFRGAITRDLVFEISSEDGVGRHFVFRDRRVSSHVFVADAVEVKFPFLYVLVVAMDAIPVDDRSHRRTQRTSRLRGGLFRCAGSR